ncbi:MAG: hypothetical protein H6619_03890 [Deltaproteobacteria bacterium]|nr:hypothetical protein [Deltaproteobacteria bacterium]
MNRNERLKFDGEELTVIVSSGENQESGKVYLKSWDKQARTFRGIKGLLVCWAIGAISLGIPIVHFFSVPILFLAGFVVFFILNSQKSLIVGGMATCPNCQNETEIAKTANRWPIQDICDQCSKHFKITQE